jgi:hypothetical protein
MPLRIRIMTDYGMTDYGTSTGFQDSHLVRLDVSLGRLENENQRRQTFSTMRSRSARASGSIEMPEAAPAVTKAASIPQSDVFEIESSKPAQQKSQAASMKDFAKQMITDHTKSSDELRSLG